MTMLGWSRAKHGLFGPVANREIGALLMGLRRLEARRAAPAMDSAVLEEALENLGLEPVVSFRPSRHGAGLTRSHDAVVSCIPVQHCLVKISTPEFTSQSTFMIGLCHYDGSHANMWGPFCNYAEQQCTITRDLRDDMASKCHRVYSDLSLADMTYARTSSSGYTSFAMRASDEQDELFMIVYLSCKGTVKIYI